MFYTVNPANGQELKTFPALSNDECQEALQRSAEAFSEWQRIPIHDRAAVIERLSGLLLAEKEQLARIITLEMGKPIRQSRGEIEKCAWLCRFYAEHGTCFLAADPIDAGYAKSYVRYDPLGVILGVMPWNFPFWQVFRYAVPALLAGNVVILKPAPNVPQCGRQVERLLAEAAGRPYLFQTLFLEEKQVEQVIAHDVVQGVALTGSARAGAAVAALAGKYLKKCVMELGGSDAFIVLEDADIEQAAQVAVESRMNNSGQTCIAAKRLIVVSSVLEPFREALLKEVDALKVGDPLVEDTDIGPLARPDLRDNLARQVAESVQQGGQLIRTGGALTEQDAAYFLPTVLTNIQPGTPAYEEELFGPVITLFEVPDEEAALRLANDTVYGLGAAIWSRDIARAERVAARIQAGAVSINGMVKSDPHLPFGGVKRSGFGRELGHAGILEFVNMKSVVVYEPT